MHIRVETLKKNLIKALHTNLSALRSPHPVSLFLHLRGSRETGRLHQSLLCFDRQPKLRAVSQLSSGLKTLEAARKTHLFSLPCSSLLYG